MFTSHHRNFTLELFFSDVKLLLPNLQYSSALSTFWSKDSPPYLFLRESRSFCEAAAKFLD